MKVAVVFLFSLVAISTQQQLMWLVPYVSPHSYYNSHMMRENHYDPSESDPPSLESRESPQNGFMNRNYNDYNSFNNDPYNNFYNNQQFQTYERPGFLRTIYVTRWVTVTTARISQCFPATYFVGGTAPRCLRRKRHSEIDDVHPNADGDRGNIAASNVVKFIPTALPVNTGRNSDSMREIASSKDESQSDGWQDWQDRQQRPVPSYRFFNFNFLPTRTITSYWFNSTIIFKRVTIGDNNILNSQLKCLPDGFTVC